LLAKAVFPYSIIPDIQTENSSNFNNKSITMGVIYERANDALRTNPPAGDRALSQNGSDWLWAVMAVFALCFLIFFALIWAAKAGEKIFHYLFITALLVGSIVYFAQASDLGWSVVSQANHIARGPLRQIFWAKYVGWTVFFPVVIIALGLLSGVSWTTIFYEVILSWIWVISYLVGAYTRTTYKWGFFVFGTLAWMALAMHTLMDGSKNSRRLDTAKHYTPLAGWVNLLWLLYPIAWALSDGSNYIGVTESFIWYGILDLLLIPVTAFAFLFLSRSWDYNRLGLAFTQYGRVNTHPGHFPEKNTVPVGGNNAGTVPATGTTAV